MGMAVPMARGSFGTLGLTKTTRKRSATTSNAINLGALAKPGAKPRSQVTLSARLAHRRDGG